MSKNRKTKHNKKAVYSSRTDSFRLADSNTPSANTAAHQTADEQTTSEDQTVSKDNTTVTTISKKQQLLELWKGNRSSAIPIGRSFQTRDEFIQGGEPKAGYEDKGHYRRVFVVETNQLDEMAVIKSTTSDAGEIIRDYDAVSRARDYVYTLDNNNAPIKKGPKFIENSPTKDISEEEAKRLLKKAIKQPKSYKNVAVMKERKK